MGKIVAIGLLVLSIGACALSYLVDVHEYSWAEEESLRGQLDSDATLVVALLSGSGLLAGLGALLLFGRGRGSRSIVRSVSGVSALVVTAASAARLIWLGLQ